jgi:hypothetical protein
MMKKGASFQHPFSVSSGRHIISNKKGSERKTQALHFIGSLMICVVWGFVIFSA